jgi:hypothetical protein
MSTADSGQLAKTLAICRVATGVDPKAQIAPRAGEELAALRALRERGALLEAYSPGRPGAILVFAGDEQAAAQALDELPLYRAQLLEVELIALKPFQGFE